MKTQFIPQVLAGPILRQKAQVHRTPLDKYTVRVARTVEDHENAFRLVHIAYVFQGIEHIRNGIQMRITPQHVLPESTILVAYEGDRIVGTMTCTLDSPAGLPLEGDYPLELHRLRQAGAVPVEAGSLSVVRRCWHTGVTNLMNMAGLWFAKHVLKATHLVMGVHPSAAPFYRAIYGSKPLGKPRKHVSLHAPVQGLVARLSDVETHVKRHFPHPLETGLRFGHHCFDQVPDCIELPPCSTMDELVRWKLPREVFRELFIEKSDRLETLDPKTRQHLAGWRTLRTTQSKTYSVLAGEHHD